MRYYEDLEPGMSKTFGETYEITEAEITEVGRRWDSQAFHVDKNAAKQSHFGGLIAPTALVFALGSAIANRDKNHERIAAKSALGFNNLRWHEPVRPGDIITLTESVDECRLSNSFPDSGIVKMRCDLHNQRGKLVFSYDLAVLVQRKE